MAFALRAPKVVFFKLFMLSCFYIFACLQLGYYGYYKYPRYFNSHACSEAKPKHEHNNNLCYVHFTMYLILIYSGLFNIYLYLLRLTKQIFIFYLHIFTLFLSYKSKSQHEYPTYNNLHIYRIYYTILPSNNLIVISIVINLYKISY